MGGSEGVWWGEKRGEGKGWNVGGNGRDVRLTGQCAVVLSVVCLVGPGQDVRLLGRLFVWLFGWLVVEVSRRLEGRALEPRNGSQTAPRRPKTAPRRPRTAPRRPRTAPGGPKAAKDLLCQGVSGHQGTLCQGVSCFLEGFWGGPGVVSEVPGGSPRGGRELGALLGRARGVLGGVLGRSWGGPPGVLAKSHESLGILGEILGNLQKPTKT